MSNDKERTAKVVSLLPVHDAPRTDHRALVVKRGRGRPRKVDAAPTTSDLQYHALMAQQRAEFIDEDELVKVIQEHGGASDVLFNIKREVAREAASLHFERIETEKRGRDTSQISSRRIDALKKIAEIELKVRELEAEKFDFTSPRFQKLFTLWVEQMQEVAKEVLPAEMANIFFNRFASMMEGWEEKAGNALR